MNEQPTTGQILDALLDFRDAVSAGFARERSERDAMHHDINTRVDRVERRLTTLEIRVDEGFARVDERFARVDERFARVDERFERVDERFDRIDQRLESRKGTRK